MARLAGRRSRELLGVRRVLRREVINRSGTISTITETVEHNEIKVGGPGEPLNSFVFLNPANMNGARLYGSLTRTVFNSRSTVVGLSVDRCVRGRAMSGLVNSPPKCINFSRNNRLARGVEEGPCSIILFSRVRGTRPSIFGVLLRVLRSNILASSGNHGISFGGTVVVVASGINTTGVVDDGSTLNFNNSSGSTGGDVRSLIVRSLGGAFGPRFLGEVSSVVIFGHLRGSSVGRVTTEVLGALAGHLTRVSVALRFASTTVYTVTSTNFSGICKTEPLHHTVRHGVRSPLSRLVLRGGISSNSGYAISFGSSGFAFGNRIPRRWWGGGRKTICWATLYFCFICMVVFDFRVVLRKVFLFQRRGCPFRRPYRLLYTRGCLFSTG